MLKFYSNNNRDLLAKIHSLNKLPSNESTFSDDDVIMEFVIEKQQRKEFHLISDATETSCETLICRLCGNEHFKIGQKEFFTALKCDSCGYEVGIHEG